MSKNLDYSLSSKFIKPETPKPKISRNFIVSSFEVRRIYRSTFQSNNETVFRSCVQQLSKESRTWKHERGTRVEEHNDR